MLTKSTPAQFLIRGVIYCLGLLILAFGVVFSVNSNLGVSPVSSLAYVLNQISEIPLGTCTTAVYWFYILCQLVLYGRDFRPALLLEIVFSTVFGYFVNLAKFVLGDFCLSTYFGQLAMLAVSIVLIALGLTLYMGVQLVPMASEGLVACICEKFRKPMSTVKTCFDCVSVSVGAVLCLIFLGKIVGIREGTVITALLAGKLMGRIKKRLDPMLDRVCFGK